MLRSAGRPDSGETRTILVVLIAFSIIAALVYVNRENPELAGATRAAADYADAWQSGDLASLKYDAGSSAEVTRGQPRRADGERVARRVAFIVEHLGDAGSGDAGAVRTRIRPEKVEVVESATRRTSADRATARLQVTWRLPLRSGPGQRHHRWTYAVTLQERLVGGNWRILWTPQVVHPSLRSGQVLVAQRSLPAEATVVGAGDTVLYPPPGGGRPVAATLLGALTGQLAPDPVQGTGRATGQGQGRSTEQGPGRPAGQGGNGGDGTTDAPGTELTDLYDGRLAAHAGIEVGVHAAEPVGDPEERTVPRLRSRVAVVFTGPPGTVDPVRVTLDRRTQTAAQGALAGIGGTAAMVVVQPATGDLLAVANTQDAAAQAPTTPAPDRGLLAQQPPGAVFGLVSSLALLRSGYRTTSLVDCSNRYTVGGRVFENTQGPSLKDVTLAAAVDGGCVTGLARVAGATTPEALQTAAHDLGVAVPRDDAGAPGLLRVADRLGTPAFHGQVPRAPTPLAHAENLVGEGNVLVSPLSMARAAAAVAAATRRAVRLVVDPPPQHGDLPGGLTPAEARDLQDIMAKGVTESGGSAHALAPLGDVHALAGTAGRGGGAARTHQAWCVGYVNGYAFAVLVTDVAGSPAAARALALRATGAFLTASR